MERIKIIIDMLKNSFSNVRLLINYTIRENSPIVQIINIKVTTFSLCSHKFVSDVFYFTQINKEAF